jgi:RND family efflux transporter MFP subunit
MSAPPIAKIVLPVLILAAGVGGAKFLIAQKTTTETKPPVARVAAVEFIEVSAGAPRARIEATGTVEGDRVVALSSLVAGEVVFVADKLDPGGRFRKGATLLRVDVRDYEFMVSQEESRVQDAELAVSLEEQRGATAAREWELLGGGRDASEAPLALRGPQLAAARRNLTAARSGLDRAKLNLERTTLRAPFNAMVLTESAEVGQVLSPGAPIITLVGTDRFRVKLSVPVDQLAHLAIPGVTGSEGSRAVVVQDLGGGHRIEREAQVMMLAGQLDPQTRTADVYLSIDDPLTSEGLPLLPGAFVQATIDGLPVEGAIPIPRGAIVDGRVVWTVSAEETLERHHVTIGWRDATTAFVIDGLASGARVITTPMSLPVEGAPVRATPQPSSPAPQG